MGVVYVIDTTALIGGLDPNIINKTLWTVRAVIDEIKDASNKFRAEMALETGTIKIGTPSVIATTQVRQVAEKTGDIVALSETDIKVLALAVDLRKAGHDVIILSDDYSVQNVASQLNLKCKAYATIGIRFEITWELYCPSCFNTVEMHRPKGDAIFCSICGTKMKRRPITKENLKK
jgi:UPF0271 protein